MNPQELRRLIAEREDATRQAQRTISTGEDMLERARVVVHQVEERIHRALDLGGSIAEQSGS